jgi:hypothetical protein
VTLRPRLITSRRSSGEGIGGGEAAAAIGGGEALATAVTGVGAAPATAVIGVGAVADGGGGKLPKSKGATKTLAMTSLRQKNQPTTISRSDLTDGGRARRVPLG